MVKLIPANDKYLCAYYLDTGKKLTREDIIRQMKRDLNNPNFGYVYNDEIAFLNHLIRKYKKEKEVNYDEGLD